MSVRGLDPRAQLALLAALLGITLLGGTVGLAAGGAVAIVWTAGLGGGGRSLRPILAVAPLAVAVAVLDALAGRTAEGVAAALRLITVTGLAIAFARTVDPRAMADGLRALRVPDPLVFVLVVGARSIPVAAADLQDLTDAARLRGITVTGAAWRRAGDWLTLLVPLFVLSIHRGLQLGESMEARGYSERAHPVGRHDLRWGRRDTVAVAAAILLVAAVAIVGASLAQ